MAGARCHKVGLSRLAKGTVIQIKDTSIPAKCIEKYCCTSLVSGAIPRHTASGANYLKRIKLEEHSCINRA
jgi:hypothetical protein